MPAEQRIFDHGPHAAPAPETAAARITVVAAELGAIADEIDRGGIADRATEAAQHAITIAVHWLGRAESYLDPERAP